MRKCARWCISGGVVDDRLAANSATLMLLAAAWTKKSWTSRYVSPNMNPVKACANKSSMTRENDKMPKSSSRSLMMKCAGLPTTGTRTKTAGKRTRSKRNVVCKAERTAENTCCFALDGVLISDAYHKQQTLTGMRGAGRRRGT